MKKTLLLFYVVILTNGFIFGNNLDRSEKIKIKDLPQSSQAFIKKHFGDLSSATSAYLWQNNYSVYLKSGQKIKFYLDGNLKEADTEKGALPKSILEGIHSNIARYIDQKYREWTLIEIEVKRSKVEIELEQGRSTVSLEFSKSGELIDEDLDD